MRNSEQSVAFPYIYGTTGASINVWGTILILHPLSINYEDPWKRLRKRKEKEAMKIQSVVPTFI